MKKNVGKTDMIVRLVLAALAVILYFVVNKWLGIILIILVLILVVTAFTRTCPIWYLFRTDTLDKEKIE
jgi:Flp pilus assembly protein TadB